MRKSIAVVLTAMLAISFALVPITANADFEIKSVWGRMGGVIRDWGGNPVFGWIGAQWRIVNVNGTIHKGARVHATWSTEPHRLNCSKPPTEDFTFSFYAARLMNTTEVRMNYSGYNLLISGLWNVVNITTTIDVDENGMLISFNRTIVPVVTGAYGELHVFSNWHLFKLNITGIDVLSGFVVRVIIAYKEIHMCDVDGDGKVDLVDLVKVARRYRTMPGLFRYEHDMDFNFDDQIDMADLTTLAANIQ